MNPELRELFEIRQEDGEKKKGNPTGQNLSKHILIRLAVIIIPTICFAIGINAVNGGWEAVGLLILMAIFHAAWLLFIIIEAVILHNRKKLTLRDANLVFIVVLLLIYGIGGAFLFGFA